jgi:hypothetical protein
VVWGGRGGGEGGDGESYCTDGLANSRPVPAAQGIPPMGGHPPTPPTPTPMSVRMTRTTYHALTQSSYRGKLCCLIHGYNVDCVEKPAETQISIRLSSHL